MIITDTLAFVGNLIGFIAVAFKTIFDLYFNPRRFNKEQSSLGLLKAAEQKRARADTSTAVAFFFVSIGYLFSILALIKFS